ncbi:MFS transporter [Pseudomonas sp. B2M1-30]|uniref:MFS transporter n=1 Tax=Pseudomonas koreensis TaxID=198620 RepID=A0A9X2XFD3_9PSED|nr:MULTISPECIES: MFS transporter [Pseudomonas]MBV4474649.1 MFS transporter [Pseudomonas botevensis]MCU0119788.1 MFS transporter [Pseudomonas sp. B2M1-30]MCU7247851.1 MFS transporter [Pseudomonas koreensis]MCU7261716.1 MFS transporter [Pseudomonas koreensis]
MSKSNTSDAIFRAPAIEAILWQLSQVFWVGGLWVFHVGLVPALRIIGLAPLLVDDLAAQIDRWLIGVAAVGVLTQLVVLARVAGVSAWWRVFSGQILLVGLAACFGYYLLHYGISVDERWQMFCFVVLGISGLVLVAQSVPVRARKPHL